MFGRIKCVLFLISVLIYFSECITNKTERSVVDKNDGKSSLAFVFDVTGSMYNDLRQVREGAEMILNTALTESDVIADFVFVPYHDPAVGPATVTRNKEMFKKALNIVRVYGGGDCPEMSMSGIQMALNVSRPRSFLYVFTDATAADHKIVGKVLDLIQRKQSQVVFILTGHCNDLDKPSYKVYQQVAAASSGQIFNLNKSSVHEMLEFVKSSIKSRTVNLASLSNPAGYNYTKEIPVDSTLGEVTVSVSGVKPQITIVDPKGEQLTGPPKLITTLDLSEIMVVKVTQPEPGNWTIKVGSEEDYSVKVVGLSNVTFNHGFSTEPTVSIQETSYRPLKGTYNHMVISLTQTNVTVDIHYAEILSLNGNALFELPLTRVEGANNTYRAEPFIPPDEFFYIAINGRDQFNQELRRVGATAVQGKIPDVPYLTVQAKVEGHAHSRIVLFCNVESLVPVNVMWTKDDSKIRKEMSSLQTTSIDYVIEDMEEGDVGTYKCTARNVAGTSSATTQLDIIVDPPQVTVEPKNMSVEAGDVVTISCTVYSEALLLDNRLIFNGTNTSYAIELNKSPSIDGVYIYNKTMLLNENNTGLYSCVAANKGGRTSHSTKISIKMNPTAQILGPHTMSKRNNSELQLVCTGENARVVLWTAPNGTEYKRTDVNGTFNIALYVKSIISDGVWTCTAFRGTLKGSDSVSVIVLIKPVVNIEGDKNITVLNDTVLEVKCRVVARPAPRILWHRETEAFLNNTITEIYPMTYRSVLTLNSSAEPINGTYFCFGENSEGIHQDSLIVNVRRKMSLIKGFDDKSVRLYYQVELQCIVDVYPPAVTYWYHNGSALVTSNKVQITEDNTTVYLKRIDFNELGEYKCVVENRYEKLEIKGSITVEGLAPPILSKEPTYLATQLGRSTIITCRLLQGNPEPTVTWLYKHNKSMEFSSPPKDVIVNNDRLELMISKNSKEHSGIYHCAAHNVIGQDFYDVNLVVQYPPKFIDGTKQSDNPEMVKLGEKVTLRCDAVGLPPPVTVWTKNGHPLVFTDPISLRRNGSELLIEKASSYHTGTYTCNITSALGSTQRNFTLVVYEPPKITSATDTVQEVVEGQLVELPCTARGLPAPIVEWTQNGESIDAGKFIDKNGLRFVANLTDFGEYICTAKNTHGTDIVVYTLHVWVAPYIVLTSESIEVLVGFNSSLRCDVVGFPLPTIQWMFNEQVLEKNTTDVWFNDIGYLQITNASTKHEGMYVCLAENIAGLAEQPIYLKVNKAPEIMKDNYTGSYIATSTDTVLSIACHSTGRPDPYVMWSKDDFYLNKDPRYSIDSDGTLHIKKPSEDMSGNYTCMAKNSVGQDNKTVSVQIYSLPVRIQSEDSHTTVKLLEGSDAVVQCPVHATSVTLKWYKNAKLISEGPLHLLNVSGKDASTYSCVGTNAVGSAHSRVQVIVEWPPQFLEPTNTTIERVKGDDCYLHCDVDAKPNAMTRWVHNSKPLVFEDQQILKLINVQLHNSGSYKCIVSNVHGTVIREFVLNILEPPFISDFDMMDVQLKQGDNATLECNAKGKPAPNITWNYNNTRWQMQGPRISAVNITSQHVGLYRCDAVNRAGVAHIVYRVTVVFAPRVTDIVTYVNGEGVTVDNIVQATQGTNTRISCKASGNPLPDIQWLKQGRVISENRYDIDYTDLTLSSVETRHGGAYICVASNEGGTDVRKIKVDVLEPPRIFQSIFETTNSTNEHIEVILGQSFYLHCHPYGNPFPDVYWFKDDVPLKIFDDTIVSTEFGEVLVVKKALEEQSGNYTCVAKNKVGNTSVSYLVDVLVPPLTPKESTKKVIAKFDQSLSLSCPAMGTQPNVMWIKHPYTEINNDTRISLIDDGFTLIINKTKVSDSGNYSCIITNKVGTSEMTFDVVVYKRPFITGNIGSNHIFEEHVVSLRRSIILKCEVDGHPRPQITWLKDTQPLSESRSNIQRILGNSLLAIWSAEARDAGQYICMAENQAGTTHRRYNIAIQVPGKWRSWSSWSLCNVTCGLGYQMRARLCQYIDEHNNVIDGSSSSENILLDETACKGPKNDTRKCHMPPCEVDESKPRWTQWSQWSECSASCGPGTQVRTRRCKTKARCTHSLGLFLFLISEPPRIFQSIFETTNSTNEHIEVILGQSFYLHCHPYGNPFPDVYWFKDDVPLKIFDDTIVSTEFGEVLVVKKALEEQSGNYTCVAKNKVGNTSVSYLVDVLVPPLTPKESTKKVIAKFDQSLSLSCPAMGTQPNVMWIKHPYTEINNDTRISLIDDGFTLIINKTKVSDSGNYSCIITNKVGTSEMTFDVVVYKRPFITGNIGSNHIFEEHVVSLRRSIILKCEVDGHPRPQITWLKDTQPLSESRSNIQRILGNSLLAIWSAEARDAGQYICMAENQAGTTHRRYNIAIQVPGKWRSWSSWSLCNVTCGLGYQMRARLCQYIDEHNNVIDGSSSSENILLDETACKGPKNDTRKCHMPPCEVDESKPRWTQWSQWSECSASCGPGTQVRTRRCKTKARCAGDNVQIKKCAELPSCSSNTSVHDDVDNVSDGSDDATNSNQYLPDMIIEMHPEVINSHYSSNVEEFYSASGSQSPTVFFDVDVTENLDGSSPGPCEAGYKYNVTLNTCDDLDECTLETNQCHLTQLCMNTEGAYRCSCSPGYLALGAGQRCLDVNECELETDGCEFSCVNTAGGYVCACPRHLRLHVDGHHCVIPSLYRMPITEREPEYLSTTIDFPTKYTKTIRNT